MERSPFRTEQVRYQAARSPARVQPDHQLRAHRDRQVGILGFHRSGINVLDMHAFPAGIQIGDVAGGAIRRNRKRRATVMWEPGPVGRYDGVEVGLQGQGIGPGLQLH